MDNWTHTLLDFLLPLPIYRFDLFFQLFDFSSPIFDNLNLFVERKIIIKNQRTKHKMMVCLLRNEYPYSFSCSVGILSEGNLLNCCCCLLTCSRLVPLTAMGYNNKQMHWLNFINYVHGHFGSNITKFFSSVQYNFQLWGLCTICDFPTKADEE